MLCARYHLLDTVFMILIVRCKVGEFIANKTKNCVLEMAITDPGREVWKSQKKNTDRLHQ